MLIIMAVVINVAVIVSRQTSPFRLKLPPNDSPRTSESGCGGLVLSRTERNLDVVADRQVLDVDDLAFGVPQRAAPNVEKLTTAAFKKAVYRYGIYERLERDIHRNRRMIRGGCAADRTQASPE